MSGRIRKGDLCVVVKPTPCCGNTRKIGSIYTAFSDPELLHGMCEGCGSVRSVIAIKAGGNIGIDIGRLRRIPPLRELDAVERKAGVLA